MPPSYTVTLVYTIVTHTVDRHLTSSDQRRPYQTWKFCDDCIFSAAGHEMQNQIEFASDSEKSAYYFAVCLQY